MGKFDWVRIACQDISKSGVKGEHRTYALAKVTLEMIGEYKPLPVPLAPIARRKLLALKPEEIKDMGDTQFKAIQKEAQMASEGWLKESSAIKATNYSNLHWLTVCRDICAKFKNEEAKEKFQIAINEHEDGNEAFGDSI